MLTHIHTHFPIVLPLRYRITSNRISNSLPFRINLTFEDSHGHGRTDIIIRLDCDIPNKSYGSNITVRIPLSKTVTSCAYELGAPAQTVAYSKDEKVRRPLLFGAWCGGTLLWAWCGGCLLWAWCGGTLLWAWCGGTLLWVWCGGCLLWVWCGGTLLWAWCGGCLLWAWCGGTLLWDPVGRVARWCNEGQPSHAMSLSPSLMCLGPRRRWRRGSCQRQMAGCRTTAD